MVNYAFIRFFTFSLKRDEFSIYTDMYAISFLIIGLLSFGLENTYFRFLYKKNYNKNVVFSTIIIIQLIIISLFFFISSNFIQKIISFTGYSNHPEYFIMFSLIILFDTICIIPMAWIRMNEKPLLHTMINVIMMITQSFLITYMFSCHKNFFTIKNNYYLYFFKIVNSFTNRIGYIFFANMVASFINFILILPIILRIVRFSKFKISLAKEMIHYSFPIMTGTIAFSINENLDKILIKRWLSDDINGAYSACYKVGSFMSLYIRIFRLGIEPFFFKKSKDTNAKYFYEEITYLFILFGLLFYVLVCGNLKFIIHLLINKRYHFAISIIPIIIMGNLFLGIYNNLSIFYKILNRPLVGTYISLIGVLITLLFNFIFINNPNNNFIIPAWGTFMSYGFMLLLLFIWNKRTFPKFCKEIKNILLHFFIANFTVFITNRNQNIIINIIIQLLYLIIILIIERKKLLTLLK